MLENLALVDEIGEGIALEDFQRVQRAATDLQKSARSLRDFDIGKLGVKPSRDPQFDAFLMTQEEVTKSLISAAKAEDGKETLVALRQLLDGACLACHRDFRDRERLLSPSVLFMSTYLSSWRDMVRGLAINDFTLIARRAREIAAMSHVLSWDQVIAATFPTIDVEDRKEFRTLVHRIAAEASRIEQAAMEENAQAVMDASHRMWVDGCLSCHDQFR
jgi:cytochrome c556